MDKKNCFKKKKEMVWNLFWLLTICKKQTNKKQHLISGIY